MSGDFRISVCQMTSIDDVEFNFEQMKNLLQKASEQGRSEIAFFPENCLYMRLVEGEKIPGFTLQDTIFKRLQELSRQFDLTLHLGSVPLRIEDRLYNSSVVIDGNLVKPTYQKMHLFDIELSGEKPVRESDVFNHGQGPQILDFHGWQLGQTICYDVRFSELYSFYAKKHVDAILVPAAFLVTTGQAHWEILLRARAIESQCYVIASAQAGTHKGPRQGQRETYGRSMVIDPWGQVIWEAHSKSPEAKVLDLSRQSLEKVRRQIPMKSHRRI